MPYVMGWLRSKSPVALGEVGGYKRGRTLLTPAPRAPSVLPLLFLGAGSTSPRRFPLVSSFTFFLGWSSCPQTVEEQRQLHSLARLRPALVIAHQHEPAHLVIAVCNHRDGDLEHCRFAGSPWRRQPVRDGPACGRV